MSTADFIHESVQSPVDFAHIPAMPRQPDGLCSTNNDEVRCQTCAAEAINRDRILNPVVFFEERRPDLFRQASATDFPRTVLPACDRQPQLGLWRRTVQSAAGGNSLIDRMCLIIDIYPLMRTLR